MTGTPDDELRRLARHSLDTPEGDAVLLAWGRFLQTREQEREANSDEAREAAQQAMLAADAALAEALGTGLLRRRRLLTELAGEPVTDCRDYDERIGRAVKDATPRGRIRLRHVVTRLLLDVAGIIGTDLARHVAAHMLETAAGRTGLMHVETQRGIDPKTAAAWELRRKSSRGSVTRSAWKS